jgi:hypothetical protein
VIVRFVDIGGIFLSSLFKLSFLEGIVRFVDISGIFYHH